jgi:uncharacterized protein YkwD
MRTGEVYLLILLFLCPYIINPNSVLATSLSDRLNIRQRIQERLLPSAQPSAFPLPSSNPNPLASIRPFPLSSPFVFNFHFPFFTPSPTPNLQRDFMMGQINDYRLSQGKGSIQTDYYTCSFAEKRAKEIAASFNHSGFNTSSLPYPSYSIAVENISNASDYTKVVSLWINSPAHASNLLADITYGCVGWYETFYAFEGYKP